MILYPIRENAIEAPRPAVGMTIDHFIPPKAAICHLREPQLLN